MGAPVAIQSSTRGTNGSVPWNPNVGRVLQERRRRLQPPTPLLGSHECIVADEDNFAHVLPTGNLHTQGGSE